MAAIACVAVMCFNSPSVAATRVVTLNTLSLPGSSISPSLAEPDYPQEYVPKKQSGSELGVISGGQLALYYEILILFFALGIAIGALLCRGNTNKTVGLPSFARRTAKDGCSYVSPNKS